MHHARRASYLRLLAVLAVVVSSGTEAAAARVDWRTDLQRAALEAERQRKPMLFQITAEWCGYCHKMLEQTFTQESVAEHVNSCFIPVVIDADEHAGVVRNLGVEAFPTTLVVTPQLKLVRRIAGFQTAEELTKHLDALCSHRSETERRRTAAKPLRPQPVQPEFDGTCLVTLRDNEKLRTGTRQHSVTYNGAELWFATEEHKRRFEVDPTRYWPVWDGHCVVTGLTTRQKEPGRPRFGAIYKGRLWFFAGDSERQAFLQTPDKFPDEPSR